jgi:hypothetical protein
MATSHQADQGREARFSVPIRRTSRADFWTLVVRRGSHQLFRNAHLEFVEVHLPELDAVGSLAPKYHKHLVVARLWLRHFLA